MESLIAHRAGEIYRLRFVIEDVDVLLLRSSTGPFYPLHGWDSEKVMTWLTEHSFEYYWESDDD